MTAAAIEVIDGRRETWILIGGVGGYICAEPDPDGPDGLCGMPVESEPCDIHHPGEGEGEGEIMTAPTHTRATRATHDDVDRINRLLAASNVPVTAAIDGPPGVVLLHCALAPTTQQIARTLHVIRAVTCAPMRWAGVATAPYPPEVAP